jgi:hypothetical protein
MSPRRHPDYLRPQAGSVQRTAAKGRSAVHGPVERPLTLDDVATTLVGMAVFAALAYVCLVIA